MIIFTVILLILCVIAVVIIKESTSLAEIILLAVAIICCMLLAHNCLWKLSNGKHIDLPEEIYEVKQDDTLYINRVTKDSIYLGFKQFKHDKIRN